MKCLEEINALTVKDVGDAQIKNKRLVQWCEDANSRQKRVIYKALYVKQETWDKYHPKNWDELLRVCG